MKERKLVTNERIDFLCLISWFLIVIILWFLNKWMGFPHEFVRMFLFFLTFLVPSLYLNQRRKKQIKKVECLRKILGLTLNEVRSIAGIGHYDLVDWDWKKSYVSLRQLYLLEDELEKRFMEKYGKPFELESNHTNEI